MVMYFDVTVTFWNGLNTGIQRVVRSIAAEDIEGKLVLAVGDAEKLDRFRSISQSELSVLHDTQLSKSRKSIYFGLTTLRKLRFLMPIVNKFSLAITLKELLQTWLSPSYVIDKQFKNRPFLRIESGDIYITFDAFWNSEKDLTRIHIAKENGAKVVIFVHDVLPITHAHLFEKANVVNFNRNFTRGIQAADLLLFSSDHVLASFNFHFPNLSCLKNVIPMGSNSVISESNSVERSKTAHMLMVGTLEPRKNYLEILQWYTHTDIVNPLIIVGRAGWHSAPIKRMIRKVKRKRKDLLWFQKASDDQLVTLMRSACIGICASIDEGYGLPLREFLANNLRVVASDIKAFRAISSTGVEFFTLGDRNSLENAIQSSITKCQEDFTAVLHTWSDSYKSLISIVKSL